MKNIDQETVDGFGDEWSRFDQSDVPQEEIAALFQAYFHIFPWDCLPEEPVGFDLGCGSGRWAKLVAPKVAKLYCIDPSNEALEVAKANLQQSNNVEFLNSSVDEMPLEDGKMDFGYSLGVLHHVPNTYEAIKSCANKLKKGAPFLIYLYYAFDNRPLWYRRLWNISDCLRCIISKSPKEIRYTLSQVIAGLVYFPLARLSLLVEKAGLSIQDFPLCFYRNKSFYTMRTDALDRFGTRLEQRFTRKQIAKMLQESGFEKIVFSEQPSYWTAVGFKK